MGVVFVVTNVILLFRIYDFGFRIYFDAGFSQFVYSKGVQSGYAVSGVRSKLRFSELQVKQKSEIELPKSDFSSIFAPVNQEVFRFNNIDCFHRAPHQATGFFNPLISFYS